MPTISEALQIAIQQHQAGQLSAAEEIYRQILAVDPNCADAWHLLGVIAHQAGQHKIGIEYISKAIQLNEANPAYHCNLGEIYRALKNNPAASTCYRRALELNANDVGSLNNLGIVLLENKQLDAAIASFRRALELSPDYVEAYNNLGTALKARGQFDYAITCYQRAIALKPDYAEAYSNLGTAFKEQQNLADACSCFKHALELKPDFVDVHYNLGTTFKDQGDFDAAIACFQRAINLKPDFVIAHNNLGTALKDQGNLEAAIVCFQRAIELKPDYAEAHSNWLMTMLYAPGYDRSQMNAVEQVWGEHFAEPLVNCLVPHANDRDPQRPLRVGYVSADLYSHPVGRNIVPLLESHAHEQIKIFAYASVRKPDEMTARCRAAVDVWRDVQGESDEQVAELVRRDEIDILVDLSLHTGQNRLLVFARKPAPVQVSFAGYPGSTGLRTIEYHLTDKYLEPAGQAQPGFSSIPLRQLDSFWLFETPEFDLPLSRLPVARSGRLTFGCLNNFCKVNDEVIALWSKVLLAVPTSRLLLLVPEGSVRKRLIDVFERHGISPDRLEMIANQSRQRYFELYQGIDLGLDTFPYNGHMTTLDSFWMGVPVITLPGKTAVGRGGVSILSNLGLTELIAHDQDDYVRIAAELANDLPRLADLRATLRERMQKSPIMDAPRFARSVEAAYRQVWQRYCAN